MHRIATALADHRPRVAPVHAGRTFEAAVALVLHEREPGCPELLFIERALRAGDPWSGHMAFPGGRREATDADLRATALRETLEEVGFAPPKLLGRLDDFQGSRGPAVPDLVVGAFVYSVPESPPIVLSPEVQCTVWVPLASISDPASWAEHERLGQNGKQLFPTICYDRFRIWGLTLRILASFYGLLGERLPGPIEPRAPRSDQDRAGRPEDKAKQEAQLG
jgi:8-oxo-dGTP pyrophosphatase MutT (NUDIX family)